MIRSTTSFLAAIFASAILFSGCAKSRAEKSSGFPLPDDCSLALDSLQVKKKQNKLEETFFLNDSPYTGCAVQYPEYGLASAVRYEFQNGKITRQAAFYIDEKGPWFEINRKDGLPHGKNQIWYENGNLNTEENNFQGKKSGWQRQWFENGKVASEEYYLGDQLIYDREWNEKGIIVRDSMIEMYPAIAATIAYLDSTEFLLKDFYDSQKPDYVPAFSQLSYEQEAGMLFKFRHYDGRVEFYALDSLDGNSYFLAHLIGPMPGGAHLLLVKGSSVGFKITHDEAYFDKMSSTTGRPQLEIRPLKASNQRNIVLRWSDSVVGRSTETLAIYEVQADFLVEIAGFREYSFEGPGYRSQNPNDSIWFEIERQWETADKDQDDINEIYISGTIKTEESAGGKVVLRFKEQLIWDELEKHYQVITEGSWHVDSLGHIQPGWE